MKKLILLLIIGFTINFAQSQVVCAGISPAAIAGNYAFSWGTPANTWASPDFNLPGTSVTGDLMLVDDGSIGNSPASGLPLANYGCAPLVNNLAGKIAVVYRYDGVTASTICWMSDKALIAQNAGAIAVLIINRPGVSPDIATGGGTAAPNVTIPVVLIDYNDGALLRAELQNGPVTMFFGNKSGMYADDIGLLKANQLRSKSYGVVSQLAQNGSEFNFDLGTRIYNYGTNNQTNITITANVDDPSGSSVYNNSAGPISILSGDSIDVIPGGTFSLPQFALATYPTGKYTLSYTVSLGATDEYSGDNVLTSTFVVNDSIYSFAALDPVTNWPVPTAGYRPSSSLSTYSTCMVIDHPNASRVGALGIYFSASTGYGSGVSLTGEEIALNLYRWEDSFTDLNDVNLAFTTLTPVAFGYYYYPSDLQNQVVSGSFNVPVLFEDNQRFLACVQTVNTAIYIGHDTKTDYTWNESLYLQPMAPNESDGTYYASGFGMDKPSAIALKICSPGIKSGTFYCFGGLSENEKIEGSIYPNPINDQATIALNIDGSVELTVFDLLGKMVLNTNLILIDGKANVQLNSLDAGMYLFKITTEAGENIQINVFKN